MQPNLISDPRCVFLTTYKTYSEYVTCTRTYLCRNVEKTKKHSVPENHRCFPFAPANREDKMAKMTAAAISLSQYIKDCQLPLVRCAVETSAFCPGLVYWTIFLIPNEPKQSKTGCLPTPGLRTFARVSVFFCYPKICKSYIQNKASAQEQRTKGHSLCGQRDGKTTLSLYLCPKAPRTH